MVSFPCHWGVFRKESVTISRFTSFSELECLVFVLALHIVNDELLAAVITVGNDC